MNYHNSEEDNKRDENEEKKKRITSCYMSACVRRRVRAPLNGEIKVTITSARVRHVWAIIDRSVEKNRNENRIGVCALRGGNAGNIHTYIIYND